MRDDVRDTLREFVIVPGQAMIAADPETRLTDFLGLLEHWIGDREDSVCRRCSRPIHRYAEGPWRHSDADSSRGCRAASFDNERGWDDTLNRTWTATPGGPTPQPTDGASR